MVKHKKRFGGNNAYSYRRLSEGDEHAEHNTLHDAGHNVFIHVDDIAALDPSTSATMLGRPRNGFDSDIDQDDALHDVELDVCFPRTAKILEEGNIDYELLDNYIEEEQSFMRGGQTGADGSRRLSFPGRNGRSDAKPSALDTEPFRVTYYSPFEPATIHTRSLAEIPPEGTTLSEMIKKGCFWINLQNPTDDEMKSLSKVFRIHPLTAEDILMEEQRDKCEIFPNYFFICFRGFEGDPLSATFLQPIGLYIIVLKEGVITFHFQPTQHPYNVRKRIKQLKDYITVTPDWICYGLLDDVTDSFAPFIRSIQFEVDSIDELVLILKESEQSDMLRRIGYCRKRMMFLLRLLVSKADAVKTLIKRGDASSTTEARPSFCNEVILYLGDVQDHLISMLQSLNHYERILSRSHSNYLAQISIEMTQTNNEINDILSKLTALGSVLVPMNLVTGLWGMNVQVPGQYQEDLTWFMAILAAIMSFCICTTMLMRHYRIV